MTDVNVDLNTLKEFERRLRDFDQTLQHEFEGIESSWQVVSQAWNDPVHARFADMFQEFRPYIRHYLEAAKDYELFLKDRILALERYQS